ncbi:MAG: hypothetical protein NVSMB29_16370 [Candidatus Dormibacteria bacterium]
MSEQSPDQQPEVTDSAGSRQDTGATRGESATEAGREGGEVVDQEAATEHNRSNV